MKQTFIRILWIILTFLTALPGVFAILLSADMSYGVLSIISIILGVLLIMMSGGLIVIQVIFIWLEGGDDE